MRSKNPRLQTWLLYKEHLHLEAMCQGHHERTQYPRDELMYRLLQRAHNVVHMDLLIASIRRMDSVFGLGTILEENVNE